MKRALLVVAALAAPLLFAPAVRADDTGSGGSGDGNAPPPKVKVERTASGAKIFRITEGIVVEGRIQKPNAFYVLQRSSIDYDWESLKQDFLPRILDAASKNPF